MGHGLPKPPDLPEEYIRDVERRRVVFRSLTELVEDYTEWERKKEGNS